MGERSAARRSVTRELLAGLLQPLLFALPLLALGAWFATGRGLRPLTALAEQVRRRRPGDLAPIDVPGTPVEARPLVVALDGLMARVAASLDSERRFTGDAAHELRTPLAAIKAQAQVARGARDAAERERALAGVEAGCERGAHLVEQLLTLSRLDAAAAPAPQRCTLGPLVREVLAESAAQAAGKDMALRFDAQDDPPVDAVPELLRVLLRNLVDNAIRYSPPGTGVSAVQRREGDRLLLEVIDEGPGIPEDEREKALQRFYRVLGSGQPGSGLGLSIAQRIAALHEGTLELAKGPGGRGLNARLRLPLAR